MSDNPLIISWCPDDACDPCPGPCFYVECGAYVRSYCHTDYIAPIDIVPKHLVCRPVVGLLVTNYYNLGPGHPAVVVVWDRYYTRGDPTGQDKSKPPIENPSAVSFSVTYAWAGGGFTISGTAVSGPGGGDTFGCLYDLDGSLPGPYSYDGWAQVDGAPIAYKAGDIVMRCDTVVGAGNIDSPGTPQPGGAGTVTMVDTGVYIYA